MSHSMIEVLKSKLQSDEKVILSVCGNSMYPTITCENKIIVRKYGGQINIGDIILFEDGKMLVAHRIIRIIDKKVIIAKGDNNEMCDRPIKVKRIIGIVDNII